jgi:hypothetical protein
VAGQHEAVAGDPARAALLRFPGARIIWTAVTAMVMFALAAGRARTGRALG